MVRRTSGGRVQSLASISESTTVILGPPVSLSSARRTMYVREVIFGHQNRGVSQGPKNRTPTENVVYEWGLTRNTPCIFTGTVTDHGFSLTGPRGSPTSLTVRVVNTPSREGPLGDEGLCLQVWWEFVPLVKVGVGKGRRGVELHLRKSRGPLGPVGFLRRETPACRSTVLEGKVSVGSG